MRGVRSQNRKMKVMKEIKKERAGGGKVACPPYQHTLKCKYRSHQIQYRKGQKILYNEIKIIKSLGNYSSYCENTSILNPQAIAEYIHQAVRATE